MTRRLFCAAGGASAATVSAAAPEPASGRKPISGAWPLERLAGALLPPERSSPFPNVTDRAAWLALPADVREAAVGEAASFLGKPWPELPASLYLEFTRNGNRSRFEAQSFGRRHRLAAAAVAECMEDRGRFLDEVANGVWAICEESFWGVPASYRYPHGLPDTADPGVELFAAETAALLAWVDWLLGPRLDTVSREIRRRLRGETHRRILAPALARDDFGWMGLRSSAPVNNWNPWICSNWLTAALLLETDAGRRAASVHKAMRCLDRFLESYAADGGCDEGPSYWFRAGASLFDCLELLRAATAGAVSFYDVPLVREIGRYIYRAHIAGPWFVNFADAPARIRFRGDLIYRYGRAIGDARLAGFGAWDRAGETTARDSLGRCLPALFTAAERRRTKGAAPLVRDAWMPGIQVMAARVREGSAAGLYLAAQGGHNAESHNHNDVGNFVVYAEGEPALIDVGVETYTAKTFSSKRYEIWTMQSAYHNCPTIGGVMQRQGRQFAASEVEYRGGDDAAELSMNLAGAYPAEAGVTRWHRTLRLDRRAGRVEIADRYRLAGVKEIALTLMSALQPAPGAGSLAIGGRARVAFDAAALEPRVEEIKLEDAALRSSWGDKVYRTQLVAKRPAAEGAFTLRVEPA